MMHVLYTPPNRLSNDILRALGKIASPYLIEEEPLFQNPSLFPCAPEGFTVERHHWKRSIVGRS